MVYHYPTRIEEAQEGVRAGLHIVANLESQTSDGELRNILSTGRHYIEHARALIRSLSSNENADIEVLALTTAGVLLSLARAELHKVQNALNTFDAAAQTVEVA